jgi:hypothetical protein
MDSAKREIRREIRPQAIEKATTLFLIILRAKLKTNTNTEKQQDSPQNKALAKPATTTRANFVHSPHPNKYSASYLRNRRAAPRAITAIPAKTDMDVASGAADVADAVCVANAIMAMPNAIPKRWFLICVLFF